MTLKLAHDSANVEKLEVYNFQDIAGCARRFADQLEAGMHGEPNRVLMVIETDEGIGLAIWGENASGFEMMGILDCAKTRAYEAHVLGDD
jgi:hypothetical protein